MRLHSPCVLVCNGVWAQEETCNMMSPRPEGGADEFLPDYNAEYNYDQDSADLSLAMGGQADDMAFGEDPFGADAAEGLDMDLSAGEPVSPPPLDAYDGADLQVVYTQTLSLSSLHGPTFAAPCLTFAGADRRGASRGDAGGDQDEVLAPHTGKSVTRGSVSIALPTHVRVAGLLEPKQQSRHPVLSHTEILT